MPLPLGLDFSTPWRGDYESNRDTLGAHLYVGHSCLRQTLALWQEYQSTRLVDFTKLFREISLPVQIDVFVSKVQSTCETFEELMTNS